MFDGAQVHLLLNHIPIVGVPFSLVLLLFGLWRKNLEIQRASMGAIVLIGLLTIPAFKSGDNAEEIVEEYAGISHTMIEEHEEFGEKAFWFLEGLAIISLAGLVYFRSPRKTPTWFSVVIALGLIIGSGMMARTGHLGGLINHPEIRSSQSVVDSPGADTERDDDD